VNISYNFFVTRIDKLIVDMEQGTQKILNLAWDMEKAGQIQILREGSDGEEQVPAGVAAAAPTWKAPADTPTQQVVVPQNESVTKKALGWLTSFFATEESEEDTDKD
jgi:hypothetical protein